MRVPGFLLFAVLNLLLPALLLGSSKAQEHVDVALVLAVDVSRSMSFDELLIQRNGYAAAIESPEVIRAIAQGAHQRIAIAFFEWAGNSHAREVVSWTVIETADDAKAVAVSLQEGSTMGARRTSISGAIEHGMRLLSELPFQADRQVIDVSGDGPNNQGGPVTAARDKALEKGIVINGLPLMTRSGFGSQFNIDDLDEYYRNCVIGGPGSFVIPVNDWVQFPEAVRRKLVLEIGSRQLPAKVWRAQLRSPEPYDCLIGEAILRQRFR